MFCFDILNFSLAFLLYCQLFRIRGCPVGPLLTTVIGRDVFGVPDEPVICEDDQDRLFAVVVFTPLGEANVAAIDVVT